MVIKAKENGVHRVSSLSAGIVEEKTQCTSTTKPQWTKACTWGSCVFDN